MRKLPLTLACATILGSSNALAMGMGEIQVRSYINQPLRAEIPITDLRSGNIEGLRARLADDQAFERAGLARDAVVGRVQMHVRGGSRPLILLTSERPIRDPVLGMVIQLDGKDGAIQREYSILLDPVGYQPIRGLTPAREVAFKPDGTNALISEPESVPSSAFARGELKDGGYMVAEGDTLWSITQRFLPDGVTMQQAMAGIRRGNARAFANPSSNDALLAGSVLRIPDAATIRRMATPPARAAAASTGDADRGMDAGVPGPERGTPAPRAGAMPSVEPHLAIVQPPAMPAEGVRPAVTVPPVQAVASGASGGAVPSPVLHEQIEALKLENEALNARLARLDGQIGSMEELLRLKDLQINALERRAAEAPAVTGAPAPSPQAPALQPPAAEPTAPVVAPAMRPPLASAPETVEPDGWTRWMMNPAVLGAVGVAALLLAFLLMRMRRREQHVGSDEVDARAAALPVAAAGLATASGVASEVPDATGSLPAPPAELKPPVEEGSAADPLREALDETEVMTAYGLHDRALHVLDDAIARMPDSAELLARKVRLFHEMGDRDRFLRAAEDYRERFPADDDVVWAEIRALGEVSYADAPLFGVAGTDAHRAFEPETEPVALKGHEPLPGHVEEASEPVAAPAPGVAALEPALSLDSLAPPLSGLEPVLPSPHEEAGEPDLTETELTLEMPEPKLDISSAPVASMFESIELPPLDAHTLAFEPVGVAPEMPRAPEPLLSLDALEIGLPKAMPAEPAPAVEEISAEDMMVLGLDMDSLSDYDASGFPDMLDMEEGEALSIAGFPSPVPAEAPEAPPEAQLEGGAPPPPASMAQDEAGGDEAGGDESTMPTPFDEVETKLDIAQAYMDLGDLESAREVLEEVSMEHGETVQARAREMLDRLRG